MFVIMTAANKSITKVINGFKSGSFRNRIIAVNLLLIAVMFTMSIISYSVYNKKILRNSMDLVHQMTRKAMLEVDQYLKDIINISKAPLYDSEIMHFLEYENGLSVLEFENRIETIAFSTAFVKDEVFSVFVFDRNNKSYGKLRKGSTYKDYNPSDETWYKDALKDRSRAVVVRTHRIPYLSEITEKESEVFSVARQLYSVNLGKPVGVVLISCKLDMLKKLCSEISIHKSHRIRIIDRDGYTIYDTDEKNIGATLSKTELAEVYTNNDGYHLYNDGNDDYFTSSYTSSLTGWRIVSTVPASAVTYDVKGIINNILAINIIICMIIIILNVLVLNRITMPIKKLTALMKIVENGELNVHFKYMRMDEIGELGHGFNRMIERLRNLIEQVYKTQLREKQAELNALQNQINPHFIYNTLESIHMMAEINDDRETSGMIQTLGNLLRYSISFKKQKVTVKEEIEHLTDYLFIQKHRFDEKFDVEYDIEERLYGYEIIKLILQPLVENAIYHGLETRFGRGKITIRGYENNEGLIFQIQDNGVGMEEDRLKQLIYDINDQNSNSRSIGVRNVNERIKLHYGKKYGLEVFSVKDKGTIVKVHLPGIYKQDLTPASSPVLGRSSDETADS